MASEDKDKDQVPGPPDQRRDRRRTERRGQPLSPQEYSRRLDLLMTGVGVASELVRTSYHCLRVLGDLHQLYVTTPEPTNPLDFPWVHRTVREITMQVENLEAHIQIALTTLRRGPDDHKKNPEKDPEQDQS
jgi:hypothetical protein